MLSSHKRARSMAICASIAVMGVSAAQAEQAKANNNLFKLGYVALAFNDESDQLAGDPALTPPGVTVDIEDVGQLAGSYTRFFDDRFGLEFFLGLPFTLEVNASGTLAGAGQVAEIDVLAPTILANYYLTGRENRFRPYVSLALNHTIFYNAEATPGLEGLLLGPTSIEVDDSTGLGAFVGFNYQLKDNFYLSGLLGYVDVDAEVSLDTDTSVDFGGGPVPIGNVPRSINVELDPTVLQLTAGYSF